MNIEAQSWVWFLVMGALVGWAAGVITRGRGFGIPANILIGVGGAFLGAWVAGALGISGARSAGAFLIALGGSVLLLALTRAVKRVT